ncbi:MULTISPECIES: SAM-dependent methyltransferase [Thalassobaculum]|uniref:Cyclopropane-fatty-acyl-phospholipid synthase n=1 Tax=Thalassobaculum litoreum DSM 18839 TaxID=1123362 RepID=A0A8G2BN54_9PROT|nr:MULTISPECIES: cyclopropane-fatty-acyl-phospholipid synthase family protein [Thalassobaculum]SDG36078.1 cyclopropane-fatty-acyl-phospholipid synthase [Thalassobaculum litoreum DSM 18839]
MKDAAKQLIAKMGAADPSARFAVRFWDDDEVRVGDGEPQVTLRIKTREALSRCLADNFLGFAESYMNGDIEIDGDVDLLFKLGHIIDFGTLPMSWKEKARLAATYLLHRNTVQRSGKNARFHYNLGNDFFELFLDETFAYTCAYFHTPEDTLEQAQKQKFEHVCRKLMLKQGEHIADLGCGWGGFLIYAAETYGISGVGVTLSEPQVELGNRRIAERGLQDRIRLELKDYRELEGSFDKVGSIGMLEHAGEGYIGTFMSKISDLLKPGGVGLVHTIANDTPFPDDPWTMKYVFPGSHVPVLSHIIQEMSARRLSILDVENLRMHYPLTIKHWMERYEQNYDTVVERYGERFARMYRLYWIVSKTSFEYGGNRLFQTVFSKGLNNDLPLTRDHLYR